MVNSSDWNINNNLEQEISALSLSDPSDEHPLSAGGGGGGSGIRLITPAKQPHRTEAVNANINFRGSKICGCSN